MFNMTVMTWAERWCGSDIYRDDLTVTRVQRLLSSSRWMMTSVTAELMWWAEMMSSVDDVTEISCVWWHEYCNTSILYCKSKLVLPLRLGYLKPFLAGSKKTRQGPGCRGGALHISKCWFYLTVVARPQLIQKDYKITLCCVLLGYGSWWFNCYDMWMMKFMKWLWDWLNDELLVNCDKLRKV